MPDIPTPQHLEGAADNPFERFFGKGPLLPPALSPETVTEWNRGVEDFTRRPADVLPQTALAPGGKEENPFADLPELAPASSRTGAFLRGAERGVVPSVVSLPAIGSGAATGAYVGSFVAPWTGPFAPITEGAFTLGGGIAGGVAGSYAGNKLQDYALSIAPGWIKDPLGLSDRQREIDEKNFGTSAWLGGFVPMLATAHPNVAQMVTRDLPENPTFFQRLMAHPLTGRLFSGGVFGGMEAGQELASGEKPDWTKIGVSTGVGLLFPGMNRVGERLVESGAAPARAAFGAVTPARAARIWPAPPAPPAAGTGAAAVPEASAAAAMPPPGGASSYGDWLTAIASGAAEAQPRPAIWTPAAPDGTAGRATGVTVLPEPPTVGADGRSYQRVTAGGKESLVPADELRFVTPPARAGAEGQRELDLGAGGVVRPPPTVNDARDLGIMGEGATEETFRGQEARSPAAVESARAAKQMEEEVLGQPVAPDLHDESRRTQPDLFTEFDRLTAQRQEHLRWIDELRAAGDKPEELAQAQKHLTETDAVLRDVAQQVRGVHQATAERLGAGVVRHEETAAPLTSADRRAVAEAELPRLERLPAPEPERLAPAERATHDAIAKELLPAEKAVAASPTLTQPESQRPARPRTRRARKELSLLEFLAHRGIATSDPLAADVRSLFGGANPFVPGFGRLLRKTGGRSLDMAREAAVEAGYEIENGHESTIRHLLDALAEETRGRKRYPVGTEAWQRATERDVDRDHEAHLREEEALRQREHQLIINAFEAEGLPPPDEATMDRMINHPDWNPERPWDTFDEIVREDHLSGADEDRGRPAYPEEFDVPFETAAEDRAVPHVGAVPGRGAGAAGERGEAGGIGSGGSGEAAGHGGEPRQVGDRGGTPGRDDEGHVDLTGLYQDRGTARVPDEAAYARATPHLAAIASRIAEAAGNASDFLRSLVRTLHERYAFRADQLRRMVPYLARFGEDVDLGELNLPASGGGTLRPAWTEAMRREAAAVTASGEMPPLGSRPAPGAIPPVPAQLSAIRDDVIGQLMRAGVPQDVADKQAVLVAAHYAAWAPVFREYAGPEEFYRRESAEILKKGEASRQRAVHAAREIPGVHLGAGELTQTSAPRVGANGRITFDLTLPAGPAELFQRGSISEYGTDYARMLKDLGPQWERAVVIDADGNVVHNPPSRESIGGPAVRINRGGALSPGIVAYHGSPHDFDKFDLSKIGTGEGAQAFGHGLYFAEGEDTARYYRDAVSQNQGTPVQELMAQAIKGRSQEEAVETLRKGYELLKDSKPRGGYEPRYTAADYKEALDRMERGERHGTIYQVSINADPERFLDYDKPWNEQPQSIRDAMRSAGSGLRNHVPMTMDSVLSDFGDDVRAKKMAANMAKFQAGGMSQADLNRANQALHNANDKVLTADALREAGIPGIKYLDQGSRSSGEGTRNYVVFDDSLIQITHKDGTPVPKAERDGIVDALTESDDKKELRQLYQRNRQGPGDISAGPYGQTMLFENDRRHWWNNWQSMLTAPKNAPNRTVLRRNYVLQALTGFDREITLSPTRAKAITGKHPDIPQEVWQNLPALIANPRFAYPYRGVEGTTNVVLNATTKKGEPLTVGIRDDGEIQTITPYNDSEERTGNDRLAAAVNGAIKRGDPVYVKDASIAAAISPAAGSRNETNPQRQGKVSRGANLPYASQAPDRQSLWRPGRNVLTFDDVVQRQGRVFYQRDEGAPSEPRVNAEGLVLRLPFAEKWGDPRFDPADRERALTRLGEIASMDVAKVPWSDLVQAKRDVDEIFAQLYYYKPDYDMANVRHNPLEVWSYLHLKERPENNWNTIAGRDFDDPELGAFAKAGAEAIDHLDATDRKGVHQLLRYDTEKEPAPPRRRGPPPEQIGEKMPSGFYFAVGRKLADVPDNLFNQGGWAVINWLRQAGVSGAEIRHFQLDEKLGNQKPVTRDEFANAIAERMFDFKRKTSWLNPERSKADYAMGGTRAFTGPRIPGRGTYFERLMAFPKRLKGGEEFPPGTFESPHWSSILENAWASWRGSVRDMPDFGKTVIGEEGQSDFMQGASTGRRPRVTKEEWQRIKADKPRFEKVMSEGRTLVQDAFNFEYASEDQRRAAREASYDFSRDLLDHGGEVDRPQWDAHLAQAREKLNDFAAEVNLTREAVALRQQMLDRLAELRSDEGNQKFFVPDARDKYIYQDVTPETPIDQTYVRTMVRDLLLHAAKEKADSIAISTSDTTARIQNNETAAHFYDQQLKPALQRELRRITGDGSITLEKVALPKAQGAPKREKPYTVWAAKLPAKAKEAIATQGIQLFQRELAPPFFGAVERAVTAAKQTKASPDQWLGMLKNMPGVKPEELDWLNLGDWLKEQKGSVNRDQLLDYIRANRIEVKEVTKDDKEIWRLSHAGERWPEEHATEAAAQKAREEEALNLAEKEWRVVPPHQEEGEWRLRNMNDDSRDAYFETEEQAREAYENAVDESQREWITDIYIRPEQANGGAKYAQYQLPGGENYRELLLTLPQDSRLKELDDKLQAGQPMTEAERAERISREKTAYRSSHWEEPNILAHVRMNDRTINGKRTLMIEEVQSDFGQEYRRQKELISKAIDDDFDTIAAKMVEAGIIKKECD